MVSDVSSDLSYLEDSDIDEGLPESSGYGQSDRLRAWRAGQRSGAEFHSPHWSFDTEELARSADVILSGLRTSDMFGQPEGLESRGEDKKGKDSSGQGRRATREAGGEGCVNTGGGDVMGTGTTGSSDYSELAGLTHAELVRMRQQVQQESLQQQTQLRQFVKDNFAETIETIDTVRDVVAGVRAVTADDAVGGAVGKTVGDGMGGLPSYQALASAIVELDEEAEEAFRGYVERVELSENLNTVVQLFGAYDGLIVLPGLLRGRVVVGDWEGFVQGCEKAVGEIRAMARMNGTDGRNETNETSTVNTGKTANAVGGAQEGSQSLAGLDGEVWVKLEEEVVKAAEWGVGELLTMLDGVRRGEAWRADRGVGAGQGAEGLMRIGVQHGADAAWYLERLKRLDGLSLANLRDVDVLSAFVEGQVSGIMWLLSHQLDVRRRSLDDMVVAVIETSQLATEWCREYSELCGRMEGMRRRDAANAPFAEMLVAAEQREETSTPRRVFSGYAEMVKECVARALGFGLGLGLEVGGVVGGDVRGDVRGHDGLDAFDASATSIQAISGSSFQPLSSRRSSSTSSAMQLMDDLTRLVQESEHVMAALSDVWSSWCMDEEAMHNKRAATKISSLTKRPSALTLSRGSSAASASVASSSSVAVPLTPQIQDLFTQMIEHMLYVMEEYLRTNIAPKVFLLRDSFASDQRAIPHNQVNSNHINPGFIPRSNMVLLRSSIDQVMRCMSLLAKHARLIHAPIRFKANAFLKAVSAACSESIVKYVNNLPLGSSSGDLEGGAHYIDEFILLAACKALETIKTSVLPDIVTTHSNVLHMSNATATENSNAFKWCCTQLEDGQELLMKRWVEHKLQRLEPVMNTILDVSKVPLVTDAGLEGKADTGAGDGADLCGSKYQPKDAIQKLMTALKGYDTDITAMTPLLRDEVIGEMYLAVVEGFSNLVTSDVFAAAAPEASLQTWVDAKAMETWMVAELGSDDADAVVMLRDVMGRIESSVHLAEGQASGELLELTQKF